MVAAIVRAHGGEIAARSGSGGLTIEMVLPSNAATPGA
ncbi:hypothetical protein [Phenylobacterium sp.]